MNLFFQPQVSDNIHYLDPEESRHCVKVLRKKRGDIIDITDGKGFFYKAIIEEDNPKRCAFSVDRVIQEPLRRFRVHIALAPTKSIDRTEWFVEKATEIGVDEITFIYCKHSERVHLKLERMQKVAISAMKQSLKASLPLLNELVPFQTFVHKHHSDQKFIAYVDQTNPVHLMHTAKARQNSCILIGPEGDFSIEEIESAVNQGFEKVSLGKSRLRTETAALVSCHILNLINL